ncbi:MAG: phosphotransferase [Acidimicrobiales bacterium]|nr:phosphotransferase [Acidimicrobiales bacterium]
MTDATATVDSAGDEGARPPDPLIVDDPAQLTPAWFDAALGGSVAHGGASVRGVTTEPVGTGQMASTLRARLDLADGTTRTVVVKYARPDVESAMAGMAYAKEVAFYVELGERVAVRTPHCHYAAIEEGQPRFVLVLEDMADAQQGDQIGGCPVGHAEAALVNLAGLHGTTWCDEGLAASDWLGGNAAITPDVMVPVLTMAADSFAERFAAELDPAEAAVLDASRELLAAWMFDRGDHFSVVHGDYRLDNLLFPADDPTGVAAVDWQTASVGPPARDVAFFLSTCLEVEDRRRHEDDLVAAYHRSLGSHGVTGYGLDECRTDYRLGMLHGPLIILLGRLTAGVTERGDEMFRAMWRRSSAAIDDLGTLDLARARIAATS